MGIHTKWISGGRFESDPNVSLINVNEEDDLILRHGLVKVNVSDKGTEIKWCLFSSNWASLFYVMEWLRTSAGPFTLKYFLAGWFEEVIVDAGDASRRIDEILAKSDIHITKHTFVKQANPETATMPDPLKDALQDKTANPDLSIDCVFDEFMGKFAVERVGASSTIARTWGMTPVSYPCLSGHSYDQMVSQAYTKVLRSEVPHYDHIYAALARPDGKVVWMPYQRVVLPHRFPDGRKGVSVVSEIANVDIKII